MARACLAWQGKGDVRALRALELWICKPRGLRKLLRTGQSWMMARTVRRKWGETMFGCRLKSVDYSS